MYLNINELKNKFPNTLSLKEYSDSLSPDEPLIIFRNYNEPVTPPYLQSKTKVFDNENSTRNPSLAFGGRPNVPSINVIDAIKTALGPSNYALHISDGSYTGYSAYDIYEFLKNDNTNLNVWTDEIFDCDDFSQVLEGNVNNFFHGIAYGTIWYGPKSSSENWGHSVNIFYDYTDNKVWLIEPQNDTFYEFNSNIWNAWMVVI